MGGRRHLAVRWLGGVLAAVMAWPLTAGSGAVAATVDCDPDGHAWPRGPEEVQGLTFTGTVVELSESGSESPRRITFRVDRVFDGPVASTIDLSLRCVDTRFVLGQRYLVSTRDSLGVAGQELDASRLEDQETWFTDPSAVAWLIQGGDSVRLMGYAQGAADGAPAWLAGPSMLEDAVRAVLPDRHGVIHERLGTRIADDGTARTELLRSTLPVGAELPPMRFGGDWLIRADEGVLTVTLLDGSAVIGETEGIDLPHGEAITLGEDQVLMAGPDAVMRWANRGDGDVVLLSTASIPGDRPTMTTTNPQQADPAVRGPVVKRHVIRGRTPTGSRSRITVLDRSGRVTGVRIPSARELRFAGPGWSSPDGIASVGPVGHIGERRSEILIRATTTPCGPVVTVDVAEDLSAIRIVDRTPGCDAAGVGYALVLRIRGWVPGAEYIALDWERSQ
jgi:hypothetical protein